MTNPRLSTSIELIGSFLKNRSNQSSVKYIRSNVYCICKLDSFNMVLANSSSDLFFL